AGTHRPIATTLRIPGDRKLYQLSSPGSAEVTPRVIAGADPVINPRLENIGHGVVETCLMSFEVRRSVVRIRREEVFRSVVLKGAALQFREFVLRPHSAECPRHSSAGVAFGDLKMAFRAGAGFHITGVRYLR